MGSKTELRKVGSKGSKGGKRWIPDKKYFVHPWKKVPNCGMSLTFQNVDYFKKGGGGQENYRFFLAAPLT